MTGHQFAVHHDVGAWGAYVSGWTFILAVTSEQLGFDRNWKVLIFCHALGGLTMQHQPAVSKGPFGTSRSLFSYESILHPKNIV